MANDVVITEPIEGWRAWGLALDRTSVALVPIGKGPPWPRLEAATARCWKHRRHEAPVISCSCGLYAASQAGQLRRARSPAVVGTVALWGRVIKHALGWRGEFAYPQRIGLVCHVCLFQRGVRGAGADAVVAYRDRHMVALCRGHLPVMRACTDVRVDVSPAEEVLATLLDGYAVDRLPSAVVAGSCGSDP